MAAKQEHRRVLVMLGVGLVLIGALAFFNLSQGGGGGGGEEQTANTVPPSDATASAPASTPAPTPPPTAAPGEPELPNGEFDVFATRNPFEPAIDVGGASATAAPPSTAAPASGTTVTLLDVVEENGTDAARVQVGSTIYTVTVGQSFATSYRVVSLTTTCGQLLYGDTPFQLCEGEQVVR